MKQRPRLHLAATYSIITKKGFLKILFIKGASTRPTSTHIQSDTWVINNRPCKAPIEAV